MYYVYSWHLSDDFILVMTFKTNFEVVEQKNVNTKNLILLCNSFAWIKLNLAIMKVTQGSREHTCCLCYIRGILNRHSHLTAYGWQQSSCGKSSKSDPLQRYSQISEQRAQIPNEWS